MEGREGAQLFGGCRGYEDCILRYDDVPALIFFSEDVYISENRSSFDSVISCGLDDGEPLTGHRQAPDRDLPQDMT